MRSLAYVLTALLALPGGAPTAPEKTELRREPGYRSNEPRYCMLAFGPKADTRIWLALDLAYDPLREKPGDSEALYADLDGDGDLTDPNERIPVTVVLQKYTDQFTLREHERHLPRFHVGDVKGRDGRTYANLEVDVGWYVVGRGDREVRISVDVPARGRQTGGGVQFWFARTPEKAPVIWFDGPLTLRLAPSGLLHCPIDYSTREPAPPWYEEFPLVRGKRWQLRAQIGTQGTGLGTFNAIAQDIPRVDRHPIATIEFPHTDPKKPPIRRAVALTERCCGTIFAGWFEVPGDAAIGKAQVVLSMPDWSEGGVEPATVEVSVAEEDTRPPIFRERE